MEIYTDEDQKYYEKIASFGHKELHAEYQKWKKKYKAEHYNWTFGTDENMSADDLYFLCIEIHRDFLKESKNDLEEKTQKPVRKTSKSVVSAKKSKTVKEAKTKKSATAKTKKTTKKGSTKNGKGTTGNRKKSNKKTAG